MERTYNCNYCYYKSPSLDEVKSHEEYLHGCYRELNHKKSVIKRRVNTRVVRDLDAFIDYPNYKFKYGDGLFPVTKVEPNKLTKRIVYGDEYYGKPEKDMYGHTAYNGNYTVGILEKLRNGWLEKKAIYWKDYIDKYPIMKKKSKSKYNRIHKLYDEYLNYLQNKPRKYSIHLNSRQKPLRIYLMFLGEYDIPDTLKMELIVETFNEKFGVKDVNECIEVKDVGVTKEVTRL